MSGSEKIALSAAAFAGQLRRGRARFNRATVRQRHLLFTPYHTVPTTKPFGIVQ